MEVCPRCQKEFACLADDIAQCPCGTIKISQQVYEYTSEKYPSCLCLNCLQELEVIFQNNKKEDNNV